MGSRACLTCRRRKIRCDRGYPCSYCSKIGEDCIYPTVDESSSRREPRSEASAASLSGASVSAQVLEERVKRLEERISSFEGQVQDARTLASTGYRGTSQRSASQRSTSHAASLSSERRSVSSSASRSTEDEEPTGFPLTLAPRIVVDNPQITIDRARQLWRIYLTDIDPFMRIVNHGDVEAALLTFPRCSAQGTALLSAVFFATMACKHPNAKAEYQVQAQMAELALQSTNVLWRPTVSTLSALTLYLTCGRLNMDHDYLCSMVLLLVRLATKLQLHKDPDTLGFSPIESEQRRRLWWYIVTLDIRTAEAYGLEPVIAVRQMGTRMPTMARDTNLLPETHVPVTFFAVVAFESANIARQVIFSLDPTRQELETRNKESRMQLLDELHQSLFNKYIKTCDCADSPVCRLTIQWFFIYWDRMKLLVLHYEKIFLRQITKDIAADAERDLLTCMGILERVRALKEQEEFSRWAWLWQNCVEWDVCAVALCTIATGNCSLDLVGRSWPVIDLVLESWDGQFGDPAHRKRFRELRAFCDWVKSTQWDDSLLSLDTLEDLA